MVKSTLVRGIKGITRQYRKVLRHLGWQFPTTGAFHVIDRAGCVVAPLDIPLVSHAYLVDGPGPESIPGTLPASAAPAPQTSGASPCYWGEEQDPCRPETPPALPEMYERRERVSATDGKKRVDYRIVKNPKPGQRYWVKRPDANGKQKWKELPFAVIADAWIEVEPCEVA